MKLKFLSYIVFSVLMLTSIWSCNGNARQRQIEAEPQRQDSIAQAEAEAEKAKTAYEDSIAIYAWGDAKFGMTKKEALQTKAFSGANNYDDSYCMDYDKTSAIQRSLGLDRSPNIWLDFGGKSKNELVKIRINRTSDYSEFSKLVNDAKIFIKEFTSKYGEPDVMASNIGTLTFRDIDNSNYYTLAKWDIGSGSGENGVKYIHMQIYTYKGDIYHLETEITNSDFPKQKIEKTQKEIEEENIKSQKAKDAIDNSF